MVDKTCSTKEVSDYLDTQNVNYNSTFYKTREDVTSKDRLELFIDQITHYMTGDIPNDPTTIIANYNNYKVIKSSNKEEILRRCE